MGAPKLTVEQLDARHAEKRAALLARHEEAEKAKAEREAGKIDRRKLASLKGYLDRNGLVLAATEVFLGLGGKCIGTIGWDAPEIPEGDDE